MKTRGRWRNGSVEIINRSGILTLKFLNNTVELRPRAIYFEKILDHRIGKDNRKKYIYIYFEELRPLPLQPILRMKNIDEFTIENYTIRYTRTAIDEYYTIITPGTHLYDYMIITGDEAGIVASIRREVYFDREDRSLTIYMV